MTEQQHARGNEIKLLSWNVNGIRAVPKRLAHKRLTDLLAQLDGDIICVQETKITRDELDETLACPEGYDAYYSYTRTTRGGYSGVATFVKESACVGVRDAEEGFTGVLSSKKSREDRRIKEIESDLSRTRLLDIYDEADAITLDSEGRVIITDHGAFVIFNCYLPCACRDEDRLAFQLDCMGALQIRFDRLRERGRHCVIVGDLNVASLKIDFPDDWLYDEFDEHKPRIWLNSLLATGVKDAFRHFHPHEKERYSCWNTKTQARKNNYGSRIDYILCDSKLCDSCLVGCDILHQQQGSDHAPVLATFSAAAVNNLLSALPISFSRPRLSTQLYPEFSRKQTSLKDFLGGIHHQPNACSSLAKSRSLPIMTPQLDGSAAPKRRSDLALESNRVKRAKQASSTGLEKSQKTLINFFPKQATSSSPSLPSISTKQERQIEEASLISVKTPKSESRRDNEATDTVERSIAVDQVKAAREWQSLLKGPPKPPLCSRHRVPSVLRTVLKDGPNKGRQFFTCALPAGKDGDIKARCNFFQWVNK